MSAADRRGVREERRSVAQVRASPGPEHRGPHASGWAEAIACLAEAAKADADARLAETFMLRNIDRRPADEQPGLTQLSASRWRVTRRQGNESASMRK